MFEGNRIYFLFILVYFFISVVDFEPVALFFQHLHISVQFRQTFPKDFEDLIPFLDWEGPTDLLDESEFVYCIDGWKNIFNKDVQVILGFNCFFSRFSILHAIRWNRL